MNEGNRLVPVNQEQQIVIVAPRRAFVPFRNAEQVARKERARDIVAAGLDALCVPIEEGLREVRENIPEVVEAAEILAHGGLDMAIEGRLPWVPGLIRNAAVAVAVNRAAPIAENAANVAVDAMEDWAGRTKEAVKNAANELIESDYCYGDEDSCVSRLTRKIEE